MPISIANKPQLTGAIVLFVGVALLVFTFVNAFLFLQEPFGMLATGDLSKVFGEALAPLIQACVRLMYLGIMGWIGSLLTVRGIPLVLHRHVPVAEPMPTVQAVAQPEPQPQPVKQPVSAPAPQPQPQSQPTPQQPKQTPQPSPPQAHPSQPTPETKPKPVPEPEAILIPPDNQKEE